MVNANQIKLYVEEKFDKVGITRKQEISRLLFEISKRENKDFRQILTDGHLQTQKFSDIKRFLLRRRFPRTIQQDHTPNIRLTALEIDPSLRVTINKQEITLKNIYVEKGVQETPLVQQLKSKFSKASFHTINSYKEETKKKKWGVADYNDRTNHFYVIEENFDFFRQCPCSPKSVFCGYHVINLGSGCAFECAYCYLQDYINSPGIVIPANIEDFFDKFREYKQDVRVGSGELTDSLIFDHITEYSPQIVEFFRDYPRSMFEFKTKSNNIKLLTSVKSAGNILISWTMNPQSIIETVEHYTASLNERIAAAKECAEAGYLVAFHFDPMIYYDRWEEEYHDLVTKLFREVPNDKIYLVSFGTLRMTPRLKKIIENRFPETTILNEEFMISHDGKLRYSPTIRSDMYTKMRKWIQEHSKKVHIYLCMEEKALCEDSKTAPIKKYRMEGYPG